MGLFNHLFKNKPSQGDEGMEEGRQAGPLDGGEEPPDSPQPDPTIFLHPKAYVPRGGAAPVLPGARHAGGRLSERKASHPAPPAAGEIILTLGDVLSRIPTQLLKGGGHDAKRELRFKIGDLSSDIARGRAVVPLSRIAALCPDIFQKAVTAAEDMDVRLPLQKLVEQIGLMRSNPPAPLPEKVAHPVLSETPPALLPTRAPLAMRTPAPAPRHAPQLKLELKPASPGALPPNAFELKPRAASPPVAPPEISKALQENILKAKPVPLRRISAESRRGIPAGPEPSKLDGKDGDALEEPSNPAPATSGKVIPFPSIAAKAEVGHAKSDEDDSEHRAERALEEKLRQLLAQKAPGESALKPELMAPSHLVTALAEIALEQSLLKTFEARDNGRKEAQEAQKSQQSLPEIFEAKKARAADVSLAQPGEPEASKDSAAKSQSLSVSRIELIESGFEPLREVHGAMRINRRAESGEAAAAIIEMPSQMIAPKKEESKTVEISAAEILEAKREGCATPGILEEREPKAEANSAFLPEIVQTEIALKEAEIGNADAKEEALTEVAKPKLPEEAVSNASHTGTPAALPVEAPSVKIASEEVEPKKPEVSAAEVVEEALKTPAAQVFPKGIVSNAEFVSLPQTEIAQTETALKETEAGKADVKEAASAALAELAEPKFSTDSNASHAGTSAALPVEAPSLKPASKEAESKKPEVSVAEDFEEALMAAATPEILEESDSRPEPRAPSQAEIATLDVAPREIESKRLQAGAEIAFEETLKELATPTSPERSGSQSETVASFPVEMPHTETPRRPPDLKKPEVSPAETLADLPLRLEEESPTHAAGRIWLSLPAILKNCPKEIFAAELPRMGGDLGIELPFAQIEPQLATGAVEISSLRFIAALPPEYMQYFVVREDVKVPIPLEEILRNLSPDLEHSGIEIMETAWKPEHPAPESQAPVAALAEPSTPPASPEHSSTPFDAVAESSPAETPGPVAPSEEPVAAADFHPEEKSAESGPPSIPEREPEQPEQPEPFVLHIPAFRVFAPPPPHVNASVASAPANPVPLAWAGHVSTQPPRSGESREEENEALHSPAPPEDSAPEPPSPNVEGPQAPGRAPPLETGAAEIAANPENAAQPAVDAPDLRPKSGAPAVAEPASEHSALRVESVREAEISATLQTQKPESPEAESAPSALPAEHTALIRPPMIRPVIVPPPRIFGFTPAVDPQTEAPLSERASEPESSAPADRETPSIPAALVPASEGAPMERAPDSPKHESVPSDAAATQPEKTAPQIAGNIAGEKAPVPAPPKIPLSVPKVPVLHVPPAPKAEAEIPAPEPIPAPPPLPLARFDQDVLQTLFMTDEFLDLPAVCRHASALPGIQACVISRRDEIAHAGEMPGGFEFSELLAFAPGVSQMAGRLPIGALKHFTLYAETHSVSFFERHGVYLCVVHRARSFIPGVREKLVTIADELSKL